jgi:hypothetical protein
MAMQHCKGCNCAEFACSFNAPGPQSSWLHLLPATGTNSVPSPSEAASSMGMTREMGADRP